VLRVIARARIARRLCAELSRCRGVVVSTQRLGCLKNGAADVKSHPWFASINWEVRRRRRRRRPLPPPVAPLRLTVVVLWTLD
jgi:hypothetical protein